ncbi:MAG: hypothetical protein IJ187_00500 [Neisseriaceae bacterium]|nr:hypothetical protein [Neisseriaceae bacterium]
MDKKNISWTPFCVLFGAFLIFACVGCLFAFGFDIAVRFCFFAILICCFLCIISLFFDIDFKRFDKYENIVTFATWICLYSCLILSQSVLIVNYENYQLKQLKIKTNNLLLSYTPCSSKNCHQSFILDKDKFAKRTYQVDITDKCVTIKPVHNYDFLYYELKKCGDEITEKEYHSTAKFLKNVATLNFSSVFGQK